LPVSVAESADTPRGMLGFRRRPLWVPTASRGLPVSPKVVAWYVSDMRIGVQLGYSGGFKEAAEQIVELERAGIEVVAVAEAYSFDAVSQLGYLAAKTSRVELVSGVLPIYTRTPALLAMTAAGLDFVSDGRFRLGIGTSGPQVVEGFHGVPFDAPLGRTREVVEICRAVWRRERVSYAGKHYQLPLPGGTGLGKPLQLINHPVRERIPISIASLGPKNVELTAEIADGWQPVFFYPERAAEVWGDALKAGAAKRDPALGPLDVMVGASLAIGDDVEDRLAWAKPQLALYIGGMGAKGRNFYHNLTTRYGFGEVADRIQELYLAGRKSEAINAVPDELVRHTSLIGPRGYVAERLAALAEAGVTTLLAGPLAAEPAEALRYMEELRALAP
jgi:F420-dependent oxidoreductase-like protein